MKGRISRIIGALLISIGITTLGYVGLEKYKAYEQQKNIMDVINASMDEHGDEIEEYKNDSTDSSSSKIQNAIGIVEIPKLDVKAGILPGTDDYTLGYAIGHFEESAMPGENGNFALAGHSNYIGAEYFKNLYKLKAGDKIKIITKKHEYTYSVTEVFEVDPADVSVLEPTKDKTITLVTCTPGAKKRVIVKGKIA